MRIKFLFAGTALATLLAVGCGSGLVPNSPNVQTPANSDLQGNWLLAGTLPDLLNGASPAAMQMTATIMVTGTSVDAIALLEPPCPNMLPGYALSVDLTGTIAADGSFTLGTYAPLQPSSATMTLQGHVPSTPGGNWIGSYTYSSTLSQCSSGSGNISAQAVAPMTGNYTGPIMSYSGASIGTLNMQLQQQTPVTSGSSFTAQFSITGAATVQLASCSLTGSTAMNNSPPSYVIGNRFSLPFAMSDGSTLSLIGFVTSLDGKQADTDLVLQNTSCSQTSVLGHAKLTQQ